MGGALILSQPARGEGYRLNVDAFLLACEAVGPAPWRSVADLGAGVGPVGLSLLAMGAAERVTLFERDGLMASLARGNTLAFADRASVVEGDVSAIEAQAEPFELVVSNPPFTDPSEGRAPPEPRRSAARHGELSPFLDAAARLLAPSGEALFIYPASTLPRLLRAAQTTGLHPRALRMIHPSPSAPARVVLARFTKLPGPFMTLAPLFERDQAGQPDPRLTTFLASQRAADS